jgi:hypothetical protein
VYREAEDLNNRVFAGISNRVKLLVVRKEQKTADMSRNIVYLSKESRLSGGVFRAGKVAKADADEAEALVRREADTL